MKKTKFFTIISVTFLLLASCTHDVNTEKNPENDTKENPEQSGQEGKESNAPAITGKGIRFDFSGATGLAVLEDIDENSRAASGVNQLGKLVKIMSDGSFENAVIIEEGCELSDISAVYKPDTPESDNIYLAFDDFSKVSANDDGNNKFGKLICVRSDGEILDILRNIQIKDSDAEDAYYVFDEENVCLDKKGNIYFIAADANSGRNSNVYESKFNYNNQIVLKFNPTDKTLSLMVAPTKDTFYSKMQIDKEGEWIFVSGNRDSAKFLRAIPVNNPEQFVNIFYSSNGNGISPKQWVYDDKSGRIYYILPLNFAQDYGLYAANRWTGFTEKWRWGQHTVTGREWFLGDEEWELFNGDPLREAYGYSSYSNFLWAWDETSVQNSQNTIDRRLSVKQIINILFNNSNYVGMRINDGYYGYTVDETDDDIPDKPENPNGINPSWESVDLCFDAFANETGAFKILYLLTKGKRNEEAVKALDCWLGKAALFAVLNNERYKVVGDADGITQHQSFMNNFASDVLYVKGTDTLVKDFEATFFSYYKLRVYNDNTHSFELTDRVDVKGVDFFKKENGYYISPAVPSLVYGITDESKPSILCYSFTKEYAEILNYFFSFCNLDGEKEFSLECFKDDKIYSSLYTDLKNEKALEWIEADYERLSLFSKAMGLKMNTYWDDETHEQIYEIRTFNEPLIQFIAKTCLLKETNETAVSWNIIENYSVGYDWGELFANDKGAYYEYYNSEVYNLVEIDASKSRFPEKIKKIDFPKGKVIQDLRNNNYFLLQLALMNGNEESGYHHIYSVNLDNGEIKNCFDNVPNHDVLEVISFSSVGDLLYYSAVHGTSVENGIVNIITNEFQSLELQRRILAVYSF